MRHRKFSQRLSRPAGHRKALLRNLTISLLKYQRIKTTRAKAKQTQSVVERLISLGKQNSVHSKRLAYKILNDRSAVVRLFSQIAPLFKNRPSGFSRIIRYAKRPGDGAELVFLELIEKLPEEKPARPKKEKPPAEKAEQPRPEVKPKEKPRLPEKPRPAKKFRPKKFLGGLRKLFKKERDSL